MKLYREVKCSDRLPEKSDVYSTNMGNIEFSKEEDTWTAVYYHEGKKRFRQVYPLEWLEPYEPPTDEEIKEVAKLYIDNKKRTAFIVGAKWMRDRLTNTK